MSGRVDAIDRDECVRLLGTQSVGRFVVVDRGRPHIVPVNYAMDGEAIVFRTAPGTKLDGASRSIAAFEVDLFDAGLQTGWSVVAHGIAQEVTSLDRPDLVARVEALPIHPWAAGEKAHIVRLAPRTVTGRRVGA